MAYDGAYPSQQRPYNGPVMPRAPPQRQFQQPGPQGRAGAGPRQKYDAYQDPNYGGGYGGEYPDSGYGGSNEFYDDQGYGYGGQQPGPGRGGRGGVPMPGGRGGMPPPRQMGMDSNGRGPYPPRGGGQPQGGMRGGGGGYQNGPPGRRPGPPDRSQTTDPRMNRPRNDDPFPSYSGQPRKRDQFDEQQRMIEDMAAMEIAAPDQGRLPPNGRPMRGGPMGDGYGPQRGPLPRGYPQQQGGPYQDPRRGPPDQGYGGRGGYRDDNFGPPSRTQTMPVMDSMSHEIPPPPRDDFGPYGSARPIGRALAMPPRPSTAQGNRPAPPPMYPEEYDNSGGDYGGGSQREQLPPRPNSFDDFYDSYYEPRDSSDYGQPDVPDFDQNPPRPARSSLDQHLYQGSVRPGQDFSQQQPTSRQQQQQRGANRYPELNKTKSQPDLRQPQTAVFEMAGDIPPMPTPKANGFPIHNGFNGLNGSSASNGHSAKYQPGPPPPPAHGPPGGPSPMRNGSAASSASASNPDALPSHPTPVRPGLMPNSLVSQQMASKPVPVRNYNPTAGAQIGTMASVSGPPPGASQAAAAQPNGVRSGPGGKSETDPPVTAEMLERLRNTVKTNPNDQATALKLAKKLVEAMDVVAPHLPDPRSRAKTRERYGYDAHKVLKKLCSQQNTDAMFFLADCLGRGVFGGEADNKEAFTLYQSAAKLGHPAAAYRTAVCCEIGNDEGGGTRKDPLKAIQWYKRAATLGDPPAMYKVGMIQLKGLLGQPRNPREAIVWLKRAAERSDSENPHALHELGLLYESAQPNDVVIRDEKYAYSLFQQAADLGYKFSQFRIGCAYEYGLMGCPIDQRLSILWYSKAATQEEHQSELALSGWYLTGADGVLQQSDTEAYLWARKAASAGLAKAEYAMGYFTEVGIGVSANLEDAKRWYWRAAAQDFPKARERLEDLKRSGRTGPRQRERISRSKIDRQQEGECVVM